MITQERLDQLAEVYNLKPLEEVFQEELMSDLFRDMLECVAAWEAKENCELLGTTIVLWAAFDKPFVELRHRAKKKETFEALCEMQQVEPEVSRTLINFTKCMGLRAGNVLAHLILMFYNGRKGE